MEATPAAETEPALPMAASRLERKQVTLANAFQRIETSATTARRCGATPFMMLDRVRRVLRRLHTRASPRTAATKKRKSRAAAKGKSSPPQAAASSNPMAGRKVIPQERAAANRSSSSSSAGQPVMKQPRTRIRGKSPVKQTAEFPAPRTKAMANRLAMAQALWPTLSHTAIDLTSETETERYESEEVAGPPAPKARKPKKVPSSSTASGRTRKE